MLLYIYLYTCILYKIKYNVDLKTDNTTRIF